MRDTFTLNFISQITIHIHTVVQVIMLCSSRSRQRLAFFLLAVGCSNSTPTLSPTTPALDELTVLTTRLTELHQRALRTPSSALERQMLALAQRRWSQLNALLSSEPKRVLAAALPQATVLSMPASLAPFIERHVDLRGSLSILAEVGLNGGERLRYRLREGYARLSPAWKLYFADGKPTAQSNTHVRIEGIAFGRHVAVRRLRLEGRAFDLQAPVGEQKLLVLLVKFNDNNDEPYDHQHVRDVLFDDGAGSVQTYYKTLSRDTTWFSGDIYGWWEIDHSKANCDPDTIRSLALTKAMQNGINLGDYKRYLIGFNEPTGGDCEFGGLGSVGGFPTTSWIRGSYFTTRVVGHELGHNHGLYHSHAYKSCTTAIPSAATCTEEEYGHRADMMGNGSTGYFAPAQLERLGWLGTSGFPSITNVTASGTYTIDRYLDGGTGVQALKIPREFDASGGKVTYYYVEYRQPVGFDINLVYYPNMVDGVIVTLATSKGSGSLDRAGQENYMLDMRPGTASTADAALAVGQSFADTDHGLSIRTVSADTASATVEVTIDPPSGSCSKAAPTLTVEEEFFFDSYFSAGDTATYEVRLTNNDSHCAATTFDFSTDLPSGWSTVGVPEKLTVPAGANATALLKVTSANSASLGTHDFAITATDVADGSHSGSNNASYVVSDCELRAPTVSISPASQEGTVGGTLTYSVNVTNNSSAGCGRGYLTVDEFAPEGWTAQVVGSFWLDPGASGSRDLTVTAPGSATTGSYAAGVLVELYGSEKKTTALASYNITDCTRAAPQVTLSPDSQTAAPGQSTTFTLTVHNNDGVTCEDQVFNLSPSLPSGWTGELDQTQLTIAASASESATLTITPATFGVSAQGYSVSVSAQGAVSSLGAADEATVNVSCVPGKPSIELSPSTQDGGPNQSKSYSVTVTNNDGAACSSADISLSVDLPQGFSGALSTNTLLLSPGASDSATLSLTAPTDVISGSFKATVHASHPSAGGDSTEATYVIGCQRNTPTVTANPSAQSGAPGVARTYNVEIVNNDQSTCGDSTFSIGVAGPDGWSAGPAAGSLTISPGSSSTTAVTITPPAAATAGHYDTTLTASRNLSADGSVTLRYSMTCSRAAPTLSVEPRSQASAPGASRNFSLRLTNNDQGACGYNNISLSALAPAGWRAQMTQSRPRLLPGQQLSLILTVDASAGAKEGTHVAEISAQGEGSAAALARATSVISCEHRSPSLTVTPENQGGQPGKSVSYELVLTNNDDAACHEGVFNLSAGLPSGFGGGLSASSLTVAPGKQASFSLQLEAPANAERKSYETTIVAENSDSGRKSAVATLSLVCDRLDPTLSISPAEQAGAAGETLAYEVSLANNDSAGCDTRTFMLAAVAPTGWEASLDDAQLSPTPGQSTLTTLRIGSPAGADLGLFTATLRALVSETAVAQADANYNVSSATCRPAAPTVRARPTSLNGATGESAIYDIEITNNDSNACPTAALPLSLDAGSFDATLSSSQVVLNPGASATVQLALTAAVDAPLGEYPFTLVVSHGERSGQATINYTVTNEVCVTNPPTLTLDPPSKTVSEATSEQLTYTLRIRNNDGQRCTQTRYSIAASADSALGLSVTRELTVPIGSTRSISVRITPRAGTANGNYRFKVSVRSPVGHRQTIQGELVVGEAGCNRQPPSISIDPERLETNLPGERGEYEVKISNRDSYACGKATYQLSTTLPEAWQIELPQTLTLAPLEERQITLVATSASDTAGGEYSFTMEAQNMTAPDYVGRADAVFVVGCIRNPPTLTATKQGDGEAVEFTLKNEDSEACGDATFSVMFTSDDGKTVFTTEFQLAPGDSHRRAVTIDGESPARVVVAASRHGATSGAQSVNTEVTLAPETFTSGGDGSGNESKSPGDDSSGGGGCSTDPSPAKRSLPGVTLLLLLAWVLRRPLPKAAKQRARKPHEPPR